MYGTLIIFLAAVCYFLTRNVLFLLLIMVVPFAYSHTKVVGGMREDGEMDKKSKNWVDSLSLIDPRFNMREVAKQMILLEDHLFHNNKHCLDCISKHTLFIEGLLEEGISMDAENKYRSELVQTLDAFKNLLPPLIKKMKQKTATDKDYIDVGNNLRKLRKPIAKNYSYFS